MADVTTATLAYTTGVDSTKSFTPNGLYIQGGGTSLSSATAFLSGNFAEKTSSPSFLAGSSAVTRTSKFGFTSGIIRASLSGYLEGNLYGEGTGVSVDYIWLKPDDGSTGWKFRVIAQDYDDGTPSKAQSIKKMLGGGIDASMGEIYYSWTPTIRVRHTEPKTDYGTLANLKYLFELNNPNATPSNTIIFVDHHGVQHNVLMVGEMRKALLGSVIEGEEAWYLISLTLQEINNA